MMHHSVMSYPDADHLASCLDHIRNAPRDSGRVELLVRRPALGEREVLARAELDQSVGVVGDTWSVRPSKKTPDGSPHPGMQVALMSARAIHALAGDRERWPIAGDNLFVDLDLGVDNLPPGSRLAIGTAVLEVTEPPHNGCAKFAERFGPAAMRWLHDDEGLRLRLRGIYTRVAVPGSIAVGDAIRVERAQISASSSMSIGSM